jgi:hypothetical protein
LQQVLRTGRLQKKQRDGQHLKEPRKEVTLEDSAGDRPHGESGGDHTEVPAKLTVKGRKKGRH